MDSIEFAIDSAPAGHGMNGSPVHSDTTRRGDSGRSDSVDAARAPGWTLLTPAVQRVVEWHQQRAQRRTQPA